MECTTLPYHCPISSYSLNDILLPVLAKQQVLILGPDSAEGVPKTHIRALRALFRLQKLCRSTSNSKKQKLQEWRLTIHTSIIGFHICFFNLPVLDNKRVSLAPITTKDGGAVEGKAKSAGKFCGGITEETDLPRKIRVYVCTQSGGLKQGTQRAPKLYG